MTDNEIKDALKYMSDVFMPMARRKVVLDGEYDYFNIDGDDLSGFTWHFNELLKHFEVTDIFNKPRWIEA